MRLWTLHPRHLDARGLVALWREGLLAQAVLRGRTRGYRAHPQLDRFRQAASPPSAIAAYLVEVRNEAARRGYRFDARRIGKPRTAPPLAATTGQLWYEWRHLKQKLRERAPAAYREALRVRQPEAHPLFRIRPGGVSVWERGALSPRAGRPVAVRGRTKARRSRRP